MFRSSWWIYPLIPVYYVINGTRDGYRFVKKKVKKVFKKDK